MRLRAFLFAVTVLLLITGCGTMTPALSDMALTPTTPHHPPQTATLNEHTHPVRHAVLLSATRIKWYILPRHGTLSAASQAVYGTAKYWPALYDRNRSKIGPNPNRVKAGTVLRAPRSPWRYHYTPPKAKPHLTAVTASPGTTAPPAGGGIYSFSALETLWVSAGGPPSAEAAAATVAECESGGNPSAYNPSGASGLFQILGAVIPGNLFNPTVNALNAVAKFKGSGDTFAQWVCKP